MFLFGEYLKLEYILSSLTPAILLNFPISDLKVELVVTSRAGGNLMGEKGGSFDPTIPFSQNLVNTGGNPFTINYLNPSNELEFFTI